MLILEYLIELSSELISDERELDLFEFEELDEMEEEERLDSLETAFESNEDYSYPERNEESELGLLSELILLSEPDPLSLISVFLITAGFSSFS